METQNTAVAKTTTAKDLFAKSNIQERFEKLLGDKAQGFISSVLQVVNNNTLLAKADPSTVLNAAATAAALDLPINANLGHSYIVPYKGQAQFQMGWKGFVQLAQRTGQYWKINAIEVYENQFKGYNALTEELDADFSIVGTGNVVGYAAYFKLKNGMEKLSYWTKEEVIKHAKKYSQAYGSKFSPWSDPDQFHAMSKKTVLKNILSKWGPVSIQLNTAIEADQSVQKEEGQYHYVDNDKTIDLDELNRIEETNRVKDFISKAKTKKELEQLEGFIEGKDEELREAFTAKEAELNGKKQAV